MGINTIVTTDLEITSRKPKALRKTKYDPKKMIEGQNRSKSGRSKLMALQDALQDPITNCEGL